MAIRAPFNFVPVSDKVYFPKWANQISHDIPFSDGMSGSIGIEITAETPVFVRNGHTKEDAEKKTEAYKSFCKTPDGRFYIPGTSIKGMVRNVLEIMSFGKMTTDKDAMFAQRDWDNNTLYPLKRGQKQFHCGYLREINGEYIIEDHDTPDRIGHDKIDDYLKKNLFRNHFSKQSHFDLNKKITQPDGSIIDPKTASFKYQLVGNKTLTDLCFSEAPSTTKHSKRLQVDSLGTIRGDIVLTGQPDQWIWPRPTTKTPNAGKFYEFVFHSEAIAKYSISEQTYKHFKFIYSESSEWPRAKGLLSGKGIPVFFRIKDGNIKDFGLAYLYKLPYDNSPYDTLPELHKDKRMDLAQCIFGTVATQNPLRGRVQFSNAFSDNAEEDEETLLILGSPKASYYPIYIYQSKEQGNQTYNDGIISGWKRYHVRNNPWQNTPSTDNTEISSIIRPLKKGTKFKGKIVFHNLRRIELGALLSAITFHGTEECYHQLGQGKPFGYGKVTIKLNDCEYDTKGLMGEYEEALENDGIKGWRETEQIVQLFSMSHEAVSDMDIFKYMHMDVENRDANEFITAKQQHEFLKLYTQISHKTYKPSPLYEQLKQKRAEALAEQERIQEAEREKDKKERSKQTEEYKKQANDLFDKQQYEEAKCLYVEASQLGIDSCSEEIAKCDKLIAIAQGSLSDYIKTSSIGACAGGIKNWQKMHLLTEDDCRLIASIIKRELPMMKKDKQKEWKDWKKWNAIIGAMQSEELAKMVYQQIIEE